MRERREEWKKKKMVVAVWWLGHQWHGLVVTGMARRPGGGGDSRPWCCPLEQREKGRGDEREILRERERKMGDRRKRERVREKEMGERGRDR